MKEPTEKQKLIDGWANSLADGGRHRDVAITLDEIWDEIEKVSVRDFIGRLRVISDHLVEETGVHTCAGGGPEVNGMHEPVCGYDMLMPLKDITVETRPPEPDPIALIVSLIGPSYSETIANIEKMGLEPKAERHMIKHMLFGAIYGANRERSLEAGAAITEYDRRKREEPKTLEQAIREGIGYDPVPLSIRDHPEITREFRTADDADGLVARITASLIKNGFVPE